MAFDPDQYLAEPFNPDKYLGDFNPDSYLEGNQNRLMKETGGIAEPALVLGSGLGMAIPGVMEGIKQNLHDKTGTPFMENMTKGFNKVMQEETYKPVTKEGKENTEKMMHALDQFQNFFGERAEKALHPKILGVKVNPKNPNEPMTNAESIAYGIGAGASNLLPLPALGKGRARPGLEATDTLGSSIEAAAKRKAEETQTPQSTPQYPHQGELPLDTPNDVDTSGIRNPYALGGQTPDFFSGRDLGVQPGPQGELFGNSPTPEQRFPDPRLAQSGPFPTEPPRPPEPTSAPPQPPVNPEAWRGNIPPEQPVQSQMSQGMQAAATSLQRQREFEMAQAQRAAQERAQAEQAYNQRELQFAERQPPPEPREARPGPPPGEQIPLGGENWRDFLEPEQPVTRSQIAEKIQTALDALDKKKQRETIFNAVESERNLRKKYEENQAYNQRELQRIEPSESQRWIRDDMADSRSLDHLVMEGDSLSVMDPITAVMDIMSNSPKPLYRNIALWLLKYPSIFDDLSIVVHQHMDRLPNGGRASYDGERQVISLSRDGLNERGLIHEMIHAATVRAYHTNPKLNAEVNRLWKKAVAKIPDTNDHYGLTEPKEMLAEALSNREFRAALVKVQPTLWDRIVNLISKVLGLPQRELRNLLEDVEHVADDAITWHAGKDLSNDRIFSNLRSDMASEIEDLKPSKWDTPLAEEENQRKVVAGVPGLKTVVDNMIPEYRSIEDVLNQVKNEPDIKSKLKAFIGGGIQLAEMKGSSAIYAAHDWLSTATKKASYADREIVHPAEVMIDRLYNKDREGFKQLFSILANESAEEIRFSADELRNLGISDSIIQAHDAFRTMMDDVLKAENNARIKQGEKPVTPREGFFTSRWQGPWGMPVTKDGKIVWFLKGNTSSQVKKAMEYLKNTDPELEFGKIEYKQYPFADKSTNVEAGYKALLDILGDDPAAAEVKRAWEEYQTSEGKKALDQQKHFKQKSGVRGYAGDRPWMNSDKDMLEAMKEQFKYARNGYRWSELQEAVDRIKQMNSALDDKPNTQGMVRDYTKNHLGMGEDHTVRQIENRIGKYWSQHIPVSASDMMEMVRSLFYIKTLGVFNVPFSFTSLVQPLFTGAEHFNLSFDGYKHNPVKSLADSMHDGLAILQHNLQEIAPNSNMAKGLSQKIKDSLKDPFLRDMAEYARQNGIVSINQFSDIRNMGSPVRQTLERWGGFNLIATEAASRAMAFAGFVSHLKQSGRFTSNLEIFKRAEELTNLTMVDYRHFERADFFNKAGLTGRMLSTLQTFHINQWNNIWRYAKEAKQGNVLPLAAYLATQFTVAGTTGMIAVETLDKLWESLKPFLPTSMQTTGVKKWLVSNLPVWASYGPLSKATGVNWSTRFDAGTIVDPSLEGLVPFGSDMYKTGKAAFGLAKDRNEARLRELAYQMSPASIKGLTDVNLFKRGNPGPTGNQLYAPTSDYSLGKPFVRTPEDIRDRSYGIRSNAEAALKDLTYRSNISEADLQHRRDRYTHDFKEAVVLGNKSDVKQAVKDFVEAEGNPQTLADWVNNTMVKSRFTPEVLQVLEDAGKSPSAARRAERLAKGLKNIKENYR